MNRDRNPDEIKDEQPRADDADHAHAVKPVEASSVLPADERQAAAHRRRRRLIISACVLVAVVAVVLIWRSRKAAAPAEAEAAPVVSVRVAKVEKQFIAAQVSALGTIYPRAQALVSPKISGQIRQMPSWKNRVVHAGEVIAILESSDLQAQRGEAAAALGEARATARSVTTGTIPQNNAQDQKALHDARNAAANARAIFERRMTLYQKGGISKKDLDASQLDLARAESDLRLSEKTVALRTGALNPNDRAQSAARVNQAEQHLGTLDAQLAYATVRAPITGVVTDQALYEGSFAASGTTLVTIADITQVIVKAPFSDTVASQLKVGDPATVQPTDLPGEKLTGQVTLISRAVDPANRSVEVWVALANGAGHLRANGAARVTVSTNAKPDALVVPLSAVTLDASNADDGTVMIVDASNVAHETKVTVGVRASDKIEIASGLTGGESVVVEGNYALPDKTKVEPNESEGQKDGGDDTKTGDAQGDAP